MDWFTGIIVFILIWWTAIFVILPLGLKRDERGIPHDPDLRKKVFLTTGLAILLWVLVYALIRIDVIDFRILAEKL